MMTLVRLPRLFRIPVAAAIAAGAIGLVYPGGLKAAWTDLRDYAAIHSEMQQETQREESLRGTSDQLSNRLMLKEVLVRDLLANRTNLISVAEQFLTLWEGDTGALDRLRQRYAGSTDLERACRNVIEYVQVHRFSSTAQAQLEAQFHSRFGQASQPVAFPKKEVAAR